MTSGFESEGSGSPYNALLDHLRNKIHFGLLVLAMTL